MPDPIPAAARDNLAELARLIRQGHRIDPADRRALADLVDELAGSLDPAAASPQAQHLAESSAALVHAWHEHHDAGLLAAARRRLEDAAVRAETKAPVAVGVARRLVDALSDLGI